jgi:D-inositol-3-phosphate glycosyltransferase
MDEMTARPDTRVAVVSFHTSPFDQPGAGASGGMNVEIRTLAGLLGDRGVAVDIYTGGEAASIEYVGPLARLIRLPEASFGGALVGSDLGPYDLIHSHYWLSGAASIAASRAWRVPLVASFHTLAEVKNRSLAPGEPPEPLSRVAEERRTMRAASRVIAPTEDDARQLVELYGADPAKIRVVSPGVDTQTFFPRDAAEARRGLGIGPGPVVLFVGRLQSLKGPDLAIRAFAEAVRSAPAPLGDATLAVVGGPSGPAGDSIPTWLHGLAEEEGVSDRVRFMDPCPHDELPWVYSAADVLLMPSRSESFGLAALEAQACGVPVVASAVGGLRSAVAHGRGGFLVEGRDPTSYSERLVQIMSSPGLSARLSRGAREHAARFPWDDTVDRLLDCYAELAPALVSPRAS